MRDLPSLQCFSRHFLLFLQLQFRQARRGRNLGEICSDLDCVGICPVKLVGIRYSSEQPTKAIFPQCRGHRRPVSSFYSLSAADEGSRTPCMGPFPEFSDHPVHPSIFGRLQTPVRTCDEAGNPTPPFKRSSEVHAPGMPAGASSESLFLREGRTAASAGRLRHVGPWAPAANRRV